MSDVKTLKNSEVNIHVDCKLGGFHKGVAGNSSVLECDDAFQCSGIWRCVPVFWNMMLCSGIWRLFQCSGIWRCVQVFCNMTLCSGIWHLFQCSGIRRCVQVFWNMTMHSSVLEYDAVFWNMTLVPVFWNITLCSSVLEYDDVLQCSGMWPLFQCSGIWRCVPVFWNMTLCSRVSGSRRLEGKFRLHLENFRVREECTFMGLEPLKIRRHVPSKCRDPLTWRSSATS